MDFAAKPACGSRYLTSDETRAHDHCGATGSQVVAQACCIMGRAKNIPTSFGSRYRQATRTNTRGDHEPVK